MQRNKHISTAVSGQRSCPDDTNSPAGKATQPDTLSNNLAAITAEAAFDTFYEEQTARYGTKYPSQIYEANRSWPTFLKLALICVARGWDPADYIRTMFGQRNQSGGCLMVGDLVKPQVLASYDKKDEKSKPVDEYKHCITLLLQSEDNGTTEKSLLMSPLTPFPAWFRVFYPEQIDMELVTAWGELAKQELAPNARLIEFLKNLDSGKWDKIKRVLWFYNNPEEGAK